MCTVPTSTPIVLVDVKPGDWLSPLLGGWVQYPAGQCVSPPGDWLSPHSGLMGTVPRWKALVLVVKHTVSWQW